MKKLAFLLAILLVFTSAYAEEWDVASMDDATLHSIIDGVRNELAKRELNADENTVLFEQDGVTVYLTGDHRIDDYGDSLYLCLDAVIINENEKNVWISTDSACVNGWNVYADGMPETNSGKKQKCEVSFLISDADISTYEEVEDVEFVFSLVDAETYEVFSTTETIVLHF